MMRFIEKLSGAGIVILVTGSIFFILAGITDVNPGEVGLKIRMINIFGDAEKGMEKDVLTTGTRWINPITHETAVINYQKKQYPLNNGQELTDVPSATRDGQDVLVDVSLEIGLNPSKIPTMFVEVGTDWYNQIVLPGARSAIRDIVPTKSSDEVYTAIGRREIGDMIQTFLNEKGAPYGIEIAVNLRAINFVNPAFNQKLTDKAIAQQDIEIANRQALTAIKVADKIANIAEGNKQKTIKEAEARKEEARLEGEGRRLQKEEDAKGILAIATAEAEGVRLKREAYAGEGGAELVSIAWAENLGPNVKVYGFPTGSPGTTSVMDLNGLMQGAFKGMNTPATVIK